ncbi:MAG TPA: MFS transporter, partial [Stellaceae bacterium]|nr:MFS transporter [Stellaceae bacterium]
MAARQPVDVAEFIDESRVSGFQITLMVICGLVAMLDGFDAQLIGYVVPAIAQSWSIAGSAIGASFKWVFAAGLFGLTLGALLGGPVADRIGRKSVMLASVAVFGLFTLASALAEDASQLILLRFLTGLGLGGAMPNTIALTAEYAPHRIRTTLITAMFVGFPIGNVVAGAVSVPLMHEFGWPGVFYFGGLAPLILLPVAAALLPESVRFLVAHGRPASRVANILERIRP